MRSLWALLLLPLAVGCLHDDAYELPASSCNAPVPVPSTCSGGYRPASAAYAPPIPQTQEPPR